MREYGGRVYDGPWEGRSVTQREPWFYVSVVSTPPVLDFHPEALVEISVDYHRGEYRWSHPLRAWVFIPPSYNKENYR